MKDWIKNASSNSIWSRWGIGLLAGILLTASVAAQAPRELEVELPRGRFVGMPIHWSSVDGVLLESNGRMHQFEMKELVSHRMLDRTFSPQQLTSARHNLLAELGNGFEVLTAGPYVIAAPVGQAERWRDRFTSLLAGYKRYFEVRGWRLRPPDFPLCVIVFSNRNDFVRYAQHEGQNVPELAVGCYFPRSNRCVLYQLPGNASGAANGGNVNWEQTEATIVHEAIHQLAYNTGIHERLFQNPLWFVEGLATMFEQPAVYDSQVARSLLVDRLQPAMVQKLEPLLTNPAQLATYIELHIADDRSFQASPVEAYALAWGMTITLAERMPNGYGKYVALQQARRFGPYEAGQRMSDFRSAFGISPPELAQMMQRLLKP